MGLLFRAWLPILLFGLLALVPLLAKLGAEGFIISLLTRVVILGLAAMALDLLIGFGGLVSFGHAAFIGIGAYSVGILSSHGQEDLLVQLAVAAAVSVAFALASGAIALRTHGVYFIMITLAFGQMLFFLATSLAAYGGDDGLTLSGRSTLAGRPLLKGDVTLYYLSLAVLLLAYLLCRRLVASRFGRVLRGARENEIRMEAIGFEPFPYRLVAYAVAGALAGIAGVLLANQSEFVSPAVMSWQRSGDLIFMVVLGGLGTLHGAIIGSAAFLLIEEVLSHFTEHWRIIFGPLLILAVLFIRGGLVGRLGRGL
ncbi:branched-chain amino acid ABC transporter permease [Enterovirga aerilata]|uniref:Branched-chain amino acid ABC transporter permease n=1 Tax=Enterovirga aerilata TaxID=2730920 RepID=A0A849ICI5_9HYPH|nr:branched-chain amino acid ABC transporter permease [Enterovirga sp. DB1703]NNM74981.1 branched-chain amino acid ABC transporter permease [Enterovirga sp. DB1703]